MGKKIFPEADNNNSCVFHVNKQWTRPGLHILFDNFAGTSVLNIEFSHACSKMLTCCNRAACPSNIIHT